MKITFKTVQYGQMVRYTDTSGAVNQSHQVWFFNPRFVFLGDIYRCVPYDRIETRDDGVKWQRDRSLFFKICCKIITTLLYITQQINDKQ